jgi:ABC-type proline/glycine betaine transport system substrate-binding protein
MKKLTVAIGLVAALLVPSAAAAKQTPDNGDVRAAVSQCKSERGATKATREAFKAKYHSMRRCVRQNAAEEAEERAEARANAATECKAERADMGAEAFAAKYGTNRNGKNAFGKCVSTKAKAKKAEMDAQDKKEVQEFKAAAKACASERTTMGRDAFGEQYGTNRNGRNAFGKCVSQKVRED